MSIEGKLVSRNGTLYVLHTMYAENTPEVTYLFYRIESIRSTGYGGRPDDGDLATYRGSGEWVTRDRETHRSTGSVYVDGNAQAAHSVTVSVPAPRTRGKQLRWARGRWEKLMARGWTVAL